MGASNSILAKTSTEDASNPPTGASENVDEANCNTATKNKEQNFEVDDESCSTIVVGL